MTLYPQLIVEALIMNDAGELLLLRHDMSGKSYFLPGGRVDHGESMKEALQREVKEKVGLDSNQFDFLGMQDSIVDLDFQKKEHCVCANYVCRVPQSEILLIGEAHSFLWVKPVDALSYTINTTTETAIKQFLIAQDIDFKTTLGQFKYSVRGVAVKDGKILLVTDDRFDFWFLPGGKVGLFEPSDTALKREMREELGIEPCIERLLWTTETVFYFMKRNVHELSSIYLMSFPEGASIYSQESGTGLEEAEGEMISLKFKWFDIEELHTVTLVPEFLKEKLKDIPVTTHHLIIDEREKK